MCIILRKAGDSLVTKMDRRIRKSQEAIKTAIIELMMEKDFDQITIQDISDKADISRRTIYLHYTDKFDLLDKLIEEHIDDIRKLCDSAEDETPYSEVGVLWFQYFERHSLFFSALLASKGSPFFRTRFLAFFLDELEDENGLSEENNHGLTEGMEVEKQFLGAAVVGVIEWWFKNEMPLSPSIMAQRLGALLERNLEWDVPVSSR